MVRKFMNVSVIPFIPFNFMRISLYRFIGFRIGRKTFIGMRCYLDDLNTDKIIIGNNVTISYCCCFAAHGRFGGYGKIILKDHCYVGMSVNIASPKGDLFIGKNTVIGAGALVINSIPDGKIAVGVPAKVVGDV